MAQDISITLDAKGLFTFQNQFSPDYVPEGSMSEATNVVIDKDGLVSPRRGFEALFDFAGKPKAFVNFKNSIIVHIAENLYKIDGITGSSPSISFLADNVVNDLGLTFAQANENLYFPTANGVQKIANYGFSPVVDAGAPESLNIVQNGNPTASGTAMAQSTSRAYKAVFGYRDSNNNVILGAPSSKLTVATSSTVGFYDVPLRVYIPPTIVDAATWFVQIYATLTAPSPTDPGEEFRLALETSLLSANVSDGYIDVTDITPDDLLQGAFLYTNANEEGTFAANQQPPNCADLAFYQNHMFYGNTKQKRVFNFTLLATGADGLKDGDKIRIYGNPLVPTSYDEYTAKTTPSAPNDFKLYDGGTDLFDDIANTALAFVTKVNATANRYYAIYDSTVDSLPGIMRLVEADFGSAGLLQVEISYASPTPTDQGAGRLYSNIFTPILRHQVKNDSTQEVKINRLYFSKYQEPEAVPYVNFLDVGQSDEAILRLAALRSLLVIFTSRGVYKLTGSDSSSFQVSLVDNTAQLVAPNSVVPLNNSVYALFDQGVGQVTNNGVSILSRPIEGDLSEIRGAAGDYVRTLGFAVGYEADRKYLISLPAAADDTTNPTIVYAYNTVTQTWTTFDMATSAGLISLDSKLLYARLLDNTWKMCRERKNFSDFDYTDEEYSITPEFYAGPLVSLGIGPVTVPEVDDVVFKSSLSYTKVKSIVLPTSDNPNTYLMLADDIRFSGLVRSLDQPNKKFEVKRVDPEWAPGSVLQFVNTDNQLTTQALPVTIVSIVDKVIEVDNWPSDIDLAYYAFEAQDMTLRRAIPIRITWNPFTAKSPGVLKQFSEALVLTKTQLENFTLSFSSGNSQAFEGVSFTGQAVGAWGLFAWGEAAWGGEASLYRYRTYVPKEKQRDSFLVMKIEQRTSFNGFEIAGIQLTFRSLSNKPNR